MWKLSDFWWHGTARRRCFTWSYQRTSFSRGDVSEYLFIRLDHLGDDARKDTALNWFISYLWKTYSSPSFCHIIWCLFNERYGELGQNSECCWWDLISMTAYFRGWLVLIFCSDTRDAQHECSITWVTNTLIGRFKKYMLFFDNNYFIDYIQSNIQRTFKY